MRSVSITNRLSLEEIFLKRYDYLLKSALRVTKYDREMAEDLVQEVFVRFTSGNPNVVAIDNIDNYLYAVLRNLHLAHIQRTTKQRLEQLSTFEDDATGLDRRLVTDPQPQIRVQDELRAICRYACIRKETSISGSVLILRFFLGYFPTEVAQLIRCPRNVVEVRLNSARREAQGFLANPNSLTSFARSFTCHTPRLCSVQHTSNILDELRQEIFAAQRSPCLTSRELLDIYSYEKVKLTCRALSHLVSCPCCLNEASNLLGLQPLHERNPNDVLGRETLINRGGAVDKATSPDRLSPNDGGKVKAAHG